MSAITPKQAKPLIPMEKITHTQTKLRVILWLALTGLCGTLAVLSGLYLYLSPKLPEVETLRQIKLQTPLRIYSADNRLIGEFGEKRRQPIDYSEIPQPYIDAILSAEDDQFYAHHGVSIKALLRAASQLLTTGHIQTGGSTITMQVARNFFLSRKQTFARKFNEILLALEIESKLSKQEILELYVNKIYLGNRAYGIQAAAQVYYGTSIDQLTLAQLAMIAGLPKAPSAYNPIANPDRALIRRNWILQRMLELGHIDKTSQQLASQEPVTASYHGQHLDLNAPYIAEMARKEAVDLLGNAAYTDGYRVYTTVDSQLQARAQTAVTEGLMAYDKRHGYRGPEEQFALPAPQSDSSELAIDTLDSEAIDPIIDPTTTDDTNQAANPTENYSDQQLQQLLEQLRAIPNSSQLQPAIILSTQERSATALLKSGDIIKLDWQRGLKNARPYISENRLGPRPKQAADIVEPGDVVRLQERLPNQWHLTQVPAAQAALVALNPPYGASIKL